MNHALQSEAALALAKKESVEHMHGMLEIQQIMKNRPLLLHARILNLNPQHDAAIVDVTQHGRQSNNNIKIIHFIRHGQGFHNLLADIMSSHGKTWQQFSQSTENPYTRPEILDAPLTEIGRQQALAIQFRIRHFKRVFLPLNNFWMGQFHLFHTNCFEKKRVFIFVINDVLNPDKKLNSLRLIFHL
jgi:lipopolysaccharide biosynthesis glycosyltransferase